LKKITSNELRELFFRFCAKKGHYILPAESLVPKKNETVLFTNSGMLPMIAHMLNGSHPMGRRVCNIQNVVRTGVLDRVGDASHETCFEVFGMWSFGDYGVEDALAYVIEFLTFEQWLSLDFTRLHCTCFAGDDVIAQNAEIQSVLQKLGFDPSHIHLSEKNKKGPYKGNGLFGENVRIHYDKGLKPCSDTCDPYCRCGKYTEIWDVVFFSKRYEYEGHICNIPETIVDMGAGFDRILALLNGVESVYDTDLFATVIDRVVEIAGSKSAPSLRDRRVIADHCRCIAFILGDTNRVIPSNTGRGYVVRRLIRTVLQKLNVIGAQKGTMQLLIDGIIQQYGALYPHLQKNRAYVLEQLGAEESRYITAIEKGEKEIRKRIKADKIHEKMSGETAFMLYSSLGVPLSRIEKVAEEYGISVDIIGFELCYKKFRGKT